MAKYQLRMFDPKRELDNIIKEVKDKWLATKIRVFEKEFSKWKREVDKRIIKIESEISRLKIKR